MARRKGIPGWHAMRKEELVRALLKAYKSEPSSKSHGPANSRVGNAKPQNGASAAGRTPPNAAKPRSPAVERRLKQLRARLSQARDLACDDGNGNGHGKDRLVVLVRDSYWVQAYWELTRQSIERAKMALGQSWHAAKPVLRVFEVARDGTTNTARKLVREVEVRGGMNNWYVDVGTPGRSFQLDIGYRVPDGKFFCLARSNVVTTPQTSCLNALEAKLPGSDSELDRIYALSGGYGGENDSTELKELFEERLQRPIGNPLSAHLGLPPSLAGDGSRREFPFEVDTELVIFGVTDAGAQITVKGQPVRVRPDGTFSVRVNLPDRRHVLPVVANSSDGLETRTIVLAVERNTKVMEPVIREPEAS